MADAQIAIIDGDQTQVVLAPGENPAIVTSIPGPQGPAGAGVPTGGAANEVLYKVSSTFGDTAWGPITSAMIGDLQIVNADVSASAAIAGTKISPNFGSQNVTTTGTSTAASFIPTSSTAPTNGLYLSAANSVALSTNGTGRLFVDASGNIATGVATYSKPLTINNANAAIALRANSGGTYSDHGIFFAVDGANYSQIYNDGIGQLIFRTGSALNERLRITSTGQLSHIGAGSSGSPAVSFSGSAASNSLVVDSSSRVGIGTSSPAAIFSSKPSASSTTAATTFTGDGLFIDCANTTDGIGNYGGAISWSRSASSTTRAAAIANVQTGSDSDVQGLAFLTHASATSTAPLIEAMRITGAGLVGIGTPTVNRQLVLNDNTLACLALQNSTTGNATGDGFQIQLSGTDAYIWNYETAPIAFGTNNVERARIDSSGTFRVKGAGTGGVNDAVQLNGSAPANSLLLDASGRVLVGTTSSIGGSTLQVAGTGGNPLEVSRFQAGNAGPFINFYKSRNATVGLNTAVIADDLLGAFQFNGAEGSGYQPAASIRAFVDSGTISSASMPGRLVFSTTADGQNSPTPRMTIKADGNVGIGTQTPGATIHSWTQSAGAATIAAALQNSSLTAGTEVRLTFSPNSNPISDNRYAWIGAINKTGSTDVELTFATAPGGAPGQERMRIDSSGRLLVGTSTSYGIGIIQAVGYAGGPGSTGVIALVHGSAALTANYDIGNIDFRDVNGAYAQIKCSSDATPGSSADFPGRLVFSTTADGASIPAERMRITSDAYVRLASGTGGIQFNGDTAAANALDDYEEGTFTPTVIGLTTAGTATYSANGQVGRYTKIGREVTFTIRSAWTAHTGTGDLAIDGLPFTSANVAGVQFTAAVLPSNLTLTASNVFYVLIDTNSTRILFYQNPAGGGASTAVPMDTAAVISITGSYFVS